MTDQITPDELPDYVVLHKNEVDAKDAEIARLTEDNKTLSDKAVGARMQLNTMRDNIKEFILESVENGEDKDLLRALAETAGIEARTEVTKSITITAEVEVEVDIFDEVDNYNFDFVITYEGDELYVRDSNIDVEDN
jgi:predicted transcriptional regulator